MDKTSRSFGIIIIVVIISITLSCVFFASRDKHIEPVSSQVVGPIDVTPSTTSTLLPTNQVKIEDQGAPLPPQIFMVTPAGGQEISPNGVVEITFTQPMSPDVTGSAFGFFNNQGKEVKGKITWLGDDTLKFIPEEPLNAGETYRLVLTDDAVSVENVPLTDSLSYEIRVAEALRISQVFPADGTTEVDNNAVFTVIFNRPVVPLSSVEDQQSFSQILEISPNILGFGEWINSSVYVFHPDDALTSSTTYTVKIEQGLKDVIGSNLQESFLWKFTTASPSISSFGVHSPINIMNPENNYEGVLLESVFEINFHQPMDRSSVLDAFLLAGMNGDKVSVTFDWFSDYQVIITPTRKLDLNTDYTFILTENAKGSTGGSLSEGLRWNFRTIPFPGILSTRPENGSIEDYFSSHFRINFKSPMKIDRLTENIILKPAAEGTLHWYYDSWSWGIDFYGLEPSTHYSVEILPGLEDIYGNVITEGYNFHFTTGMFSPTAYLDLPYGPSVYRTGGPMKFYVSYVNVGAVDVNFYHLPESYFAGFNNGAYNRWEFEPPEEWWINSWYWENSKAVNEITRRGVQLESASGDSLDPGFYFVTINSPEVPTNGTYLDTRLVVIAEANLTFKSTLTEGLVWLTDLETGAPLSDVSVTFYDHYFKEIGTGSTNSDGIFFMELPAPEEVYSSRYVMTDQGEPFAFAYSDWGSGVSPYEFGIWSDYYSLPDQPVAYLYTDRPLYRPGQTVEFKGVLRGNDDLQYRILPWEEIVVEISSYDEVVYVEKLSLSDYGTFNGSFLISESAALGYYSIIAKTAEDAEGIGGVGFSVGEYRKPEFQVISTSDQFDLVSGANFLVDIQADYYTGGSVAHAVVEWGLMSTEYIFAPQGELSRYSYVDSDLDSDIYYDENQIVQGKVIAEGKGKTDEKGSLSIPLVAGIVETGKSQLLTFESTVSDFSGTSVSDRVNIIAHQAAYYPGVRPQQYVGVEGEEQGIDIVVLDWNSKPISGAKVDVEIVERRWYSVQEQDPQGFVHWETSVEEIPVATFKNLEMGSDGHGSVSFTPANGGIFKTKVAIQDKDGNIATSSVYSWVSSANYVAWRQTDDRSMKLIADKETYQPGEMAEILIASPFTGDNYALITLERGHIQEQDVIRLTGNSTIYQLPIIPEMAPNIYMSVVVIKGAGNDDKPDFRMGLIQLDVSPEEQKIKIEITPDKFQAEPGDKVVYYIKSTDYQDQPVRAEISIALADLAALALSQPNSQPILDYFFGKRSLSVRTAVPIVYSIEHYISTLEDRLTAGEGMGSGGGKGTDIYGVFDIRGDFRDTAYWKANVITDENGEATVTVTLPDNLTTWRMDARAVTKDTRVGDSENDIRSTKPLLVRPQTPRFFVVGDRATIGAAVHNNTEENLTVEVAIDGTGIALLTAPKQKVEIAAGQQVFVTWDITVNSDANRVDLVFVVRGGRYSDASKPTLGSLDNQGIPVYRYEVPETIGTSGVINEAGSITEGLSISSEWDVTRSNLSVQVSPSLAAGMVDGLDYLEHYPYECVEQTISRFLPNVLTTKALTTAGIEDVELQGKLKQQINVATQRLYNLQRADGGWSWWPEADRSDPLTSAYVVMGLVETKAAEYSVSLDVLSRGINYLKSQLKTLGSLDHEYLLNRQAFILYVLAMAGEPQVSLTGAIYEARQSLSLYARAYLGETIWHINPQDPRIDTIVSDFVNTAILSATGVHWQEKWHDHLNWNSDTRTTAIVLATLIQIDPQNKLNVSAVRWLMNNRVKGYWKTTQETAWSLIALSRWLSFTGELTADYDWAVGINGVRLGDGSVTPGALRDTISLSADLSSLDLDEVNRLIIARDNGPGSLYYSTYLNIFLPVDRVIPVNHGIIISRDYYDPSSERFDVSVTRASKGDLLLARLTIVVPTDLHYVIINDPLPAGLEAVDQSLEISPDIAVPQGYDYESLWKQGWGWWYFDHIEFRDERVILSSDYLPAGTYVYTYFVRASTPGVFSSIPPIAQEFYFPEVYGRGAGSSFTVDP